MAAASTPAPAQASRSEPTPVEAKTRWPWLRFVTPMLVLLLGAAVAITLTRDWNAWEGEKIEQVTDDAIVRGDLTPLSTKVSGIVRNVQVSDFQRVRRGDLLVELQDDDYQAQLAQATAAVEAANAGIENNRRQRQLQDSRIQRAIAGIDKAKAQIVAAEAGISAVQADVARTSAERTRQDALYTTCGNGCGG
jgi:membrane fusion protein (multidrug efflux system)